MPRLLFLIHLSVPFTFKGSNTIHGREDGAWGVIPVYHHVGLYAYRPEALASYIKWPMGPLESLEGLEQLRFLEQGWPIAAVEVSAPGAVFWELNNPSDIPLIEDYLAGSELIRFP